MQSPLHAPPLPAAPGTAAATLTREASTGRATACEASNTRARPGGRCLHDSCCHSAVKKIRRAPGAGRRPATSPLWPLQTGVRRAGGSGEPARAYHGRFSGRAPRLRVGTLHLRMLECGRLPFSSPRGDTGAAAHPRNVLYAKTTLPQPHTSSTAANLYWIARRRRYPCNRFVRI